MTTFRFAIFNGFTTRLVEKILPSLASKQIAPVRVDRQNNTSFAHCTRLAEQAMWQAGQKLISDNDLTLVLLVSCVASEEDLACEREVFFPGTRRLAVDPAFADDVAVSQIVFNRILETFTAWESNKTYRLVRGGLNLPALLPLRNVSSKYLEREIGRIYNNDVEYLSSVVFKDIVRRKNGDGLYNRGKTYRGCVNGVDHPLQRHTDSSICDFKARFRLGTGVRERFEFDVRCDSGLEGKTFFQCDGTPSHGAAHHSHVNIRINDDLGFGNK